MQPTFLRRWASSESNLHMYSMTRTFDWVCAFSVGDPFSFGEHHSPCSIKRRLLQ